MIITIPQILSWNPCEGYETEGLLLAISGGRREMELLDILDLDIPIADRIWVGIHALPIPLVIEYACDCAWRVLPIYERQYPGDRRPRTAIEAVRMYNDGLISDVELAAARDAAGASGASWAFWDAAWTAWAAWAAWAAARDAGAAARDAEREWQIERLKHYAGMV